MAKNLAGGMSGAAKDFSFPAIPQSAIPNIQKLLLVVPHLHAALMKALLVQQSELLDFFSRRCREDLKLAEQIGASTSVAEMLAGCMSFYRDAAQQYAEEAGKVTDIGSDVAVLAAVEMREETQKVVELTRTEAA